MANDTILSTNVGTGDTIRDFDDGTRKWPVSFIAFGAVTATPIAAPTVVAATHPLPVGLYDSAGTGVTVGQGLMAASIPVVIASNQSAVPVSGTITANAGTGTFTVSGTVTANAGTGTLAVSLAAHQSVNVDECGGTAVAAGQAVMASSIPVVVASNQSAIPISGTVTANAGTGTLATNLAQVGGSAVALGQAAMAASVPVVIASNQAGFPVNIQATNGAAINLGLHVASSSVPVVTPVDVTSAGTVVMSATTNNVLGPTASGSEGTLGLNIDGTWTGTLVVEGGAVFGDWNSLPVINPTTGAIATTITANGLWKVPTAGLPNTRVRCSVTGTGTATVSFAQAMASNDVVFLGSSLPTGSNTIGTVTANAGTGTFTVSGTVTANAGTGTLAVSLANHQSVNVDEIGGSALAFGQATMANSIPVVVASNQSAVPISGTVTANAGTGTLAVSLAAHQSVNVDECGGTAVAAGQAAMAASIPVVIASNQSAVPVSGTITANAGTGTLAVNLAQVGGGAVSTSATGVANINLVPATTGGLTIYRVLWPGNATGVTIKTSAGQLYGGYMFNVAAAVRFVKLYNKATAPTVGTDTPVMTLCLPSGGGATFNFPQGIAFGTGIGVGVTNLVADSDTTAPTANDVTINLFYD